MSQSPVIGETQSGVVTRFEHWIDGRPQPPATNACLDSFDPAGGARVAERRSR